MTVAPPVPTSSNPGAGVPGASPNCGSVLERVELIAGLFEGALEPLDADEHLAVRAQQREERGHAGHHEHGERHPEAQGQRLGTAQPAHPVERAGGLLGQGAERA